MINYFLLIALLIKATITDLQDRTIPNRWTYSGTAAGLLLGSLVSFNVVAYSNVEFTNALLGSLCCFGLMFFGWLFFGLGGADVKLTASIGALLGINLGISTLFFSYTIAGILVLAWAVLRTQLVPQTLEKLFGYSPILLSKPFQRCVSFDLHKIANVEVPMAGFFLIGALCSLICGPIF